jgi:hypothetical protein
VKVTNLSILDRPPRGGLSLMTIFCSALCRDLRNDKRCGGRDETPKFSPLLTRFVLRRSTLAGPFISRCRTARRIAYGS